MRYIQFHVEWCGSPAQGGFGTMIEANLGEANRRLRERQGVSLPGLAEKTNFSPSFISQVENGQAPPSISSIERTALALGVLLRGRESGRKYY
jgi:transcriptional regulator with XRE-family HTH domain